jgi:hypothetical protein
MSKSASFHTCEAFAFERSSAVTLSLEVFERYFNSYFFLARVLWCFLWMISGISKIDSSD